MDSVENWAGNPCYAMRFVEGTSLAEVIIQYHAGRITTRGKPSRYGPAFRSLLQRFKAACTKVGYDHSRARVHRDIKPANIMLGPFDATLVLDWGLGKIIVTDDAGASSDDEQEPLMSLPGNNEIQTLGSDRHSVFHEPGSSTPGKEGNLVRPVISSAWVRPLCPADWQIAVFWSRAW